MHPYVMAEDAAAIERARTFEELMRVAERILERMPQPISMVCGPITSGGRGSIKENIEILRSAITQLRAEGKNIFDQTLFEGPMRPAGCGLYQQRSGVT